MVPMNLSAGQQWRCRHREQTHDMGGSGEGDGGVKRESGLETCTPAYVKQAMGICCVTQETQTRAL